MILHRLVALLLFFTISHNFTPVINNAHCEIREFQTTRMKSTGGAGVGAILFEEAAFINPAPLAFYNTSSLYFQKVDGSEKIQSNNGIESTQTSGTTAAILSDSSGSLKGSFSYINQESNKDLRKQFGISIAAAIGEESAFGTSLLIKKDSIFENNTYVYDNYEQVIFGVSHILSEELSFGLSVIDPFRVKPEDTKVLVGLQYVYAKFLSVMFDLGADYKKNLQESYIIKTAGQVRFLDDFFLRFGTYRDRAKKERGSGIGVSWVSPGLTAELAQNNVKKLEDVNKLISNGITELTFSLSFRF